MFQNGLGHHVKLCYALQVILLWNLDVPNGLGHHVKLCYVLQVILLWNLDVQLDGAMGWGQGGGLGQPGRLLPAGGWCSRMGSSSMLFKALPYHVLPHVGCVPEKLCRHGQAETLKSGGA